MVGLRCAFAEDAGFLFQIYRETNRDTFATLGVELCETLLRQQSSLQESQYDAQYPRLERFIISDGEDSVGRLYLDRMAGEWILVNIAVFPSRQKQGIGTRVLQDLIGEARGSGKAIRLHVMRDNPAAAWYRGHGFEDVRVKEPYVEMVLLPD